MQFVLTVKCKKSGTLTRCDLVLSEPVVLGRHMESPVPLEGDGLSRRHLSLSLEGDDVAIQDLSSNGTWLNGIQLQTQTIVNLRAGDILEIPGYEMRIAKPRAEPEQHPAQVVIEPESLSRQAEIARTVAVLLKSREGLLLGCIVASCVLLVVALTG